MRPVAWRPPAEQVVIKAVRRAKLFVFLRLHRHELFDEEFQAELAQAYADRPKGQPPVPPAQLALATILQAYTGVSDDEVVEATIMGLSSVGGPVLAGWLIDADYFGTSWRMIFLINLPLGLIALAGAIAFLPRGDRATASRLDVTGAILVAGAAALLVYPVVQGRTLGWPAWTFLLMGASIAMFALFGWYETRKQRAVAAMDDHDGMCYPLAGAAPGSQSRSGLYSSHRFARPRSAKARSSAGIEGC
jgi:hypothetical protein